MRKLFPILLLLIPCALFSQGFYVLNVKGIVKNGTTGKVIQTKDVINNSDKLIFSSLGDVVAVVHPNLGRFMLKPTKTNTRDELTVMVKDMTSQTKKMSSKMMMGPRFKESDFEYLEAYLLAGKFLLLPEMQFKVSKECCPLTDTSFFLMRYRYKGDSVTKRLASREQHFIIDSKKLLDANGESIRLTQAYEPTLFYFNGREERIVTEMYFKEADLEKVRAELEVLASVLSSANTEPPKIRSELISYVNENYGKVNPDDFDRWYGK